MSTPRSGGDSRGSAETRRRRKGWLLSPEAGHDYGQGWVPFGGDGVTVPCIHGCGRLLNFVTVESDRIVPGGPYRRDNVQPSCGPCNKARSNRTQWKGAGRSAGPSTTGISERRAR